MSEINEKKRSFNELEEESTAIFPGTLTDAIFENDFQLNEIKKRSELNFKSFEKSLDSVSETMKQSVTILNSVGESLLKKLKTFSKPEEKEKMFASLLSLYKCDNSEANELNVSAAIMEMALGSLEGECDMFSDMFDIVSTLGTAESFSHI